jgi:flagellar biosynthesis GTPase FlhF
MSAESRAADLPDIIRTYRGRTLDELLPVIERELGADAIILREREGLTGGIGGFFAQRFVEVDACPGSGASIDIYDDGSESLGSSVAAEPEELSPQARRAPARLPDEPVELGRGRRYAKPPVDDEARPAAPELAPTTAPEPAPEPAEPKFEPMVFARTDLKPKTGPRPDPEPVAFAEPDPEAQAEPEVEIEVGSRRDLKLAPDAEAAAPQSRPEPEPSENLAASPAATPGSLEIGIFRQRLREASLSFDGELDGDEHDDGELDNDGLDGAGSRPFDEASAVIDRLVSPQPKEPKAPAKPRRTPATSKNHGPGEARTTPRPTPRVRASERPKSEPKVEGDALAGQTTAELSSQRNVESNPYAAVRRDLLGEPSRPRRPAAAQLVASMPRPQRSVSAEPVPNPQRPGFLRRTPSPSPATRELAAPEIVVQPEPPIQPQRRAPEAAQPASRPVPSPLARTTRQVTRELIDAVGRILGRRRRAARFEPAPPVQLDEAEVAATVASLTARGTSGTWASQVVHAAGVHAAPLAADLHQAAIATIARDIVLAPPLPLTGAAIAFVGAGGSGKTRCAAALAGAYRRASTLSVSVITLESATVAYALGTLLERRVPVQALKLEAAREAIAKSRDGGLVVVDTPTCNPGDAAGVERLAISLEQLELDAIYVTLPATISREAAKRALDSVAALKPTAVTITHTDETDQLGVVAEVAVERQLPLAYLHGVQDGRSSITAIDPRELAEELLQ